LVLLSAPTSEVADAVAGLAATVGVFEALREGLFDSTHLVLQVRRGSCVFTNAVLELEGECGTCRSGITGKGWHRASFASCAELIEAHCCLSFCVGRGRVRSWGSARLLWRLD
jgi:hypothetical protein